MSMDHHSSKEMMGVIGWWWERNLQMVVKLAFVKQIAKDGNEKHVVNMFKEGSPLLDRQQHWPHECSQRHGNHC